MKNVNLIFPIKKSYKIIICPFHLKNATISSWAKGSCFHYFDLFLSLISFSSSQKISPK